MSHMYPLIGHPCTRSHVMIDIWEMSFHNTGFICGGAAGQICLLGKGSLQGHIVCFSLFCFVLFCLFICLFVFVCINKLFTKLWIIPWSWFRRQSFCWQQTYPLLFVLRKCGCNFKCVARTPLDLLYLDMMTSSNGNLFRVTGPLCGEFTGFRWIPRTKTSDAELWWFLWSAPQ